MSKLYLYNENTMPKKKYNVCVRDKRMNEITK